LPWSEITENLNDLIEEFEEYLEVTNVGEILRRYFVMNAFDGALTMLGFIMSSLISNVTDAHIIISAGFGMSLAMGVSGFVGALITEKAEREKQVKELEKVLLTRLSGSVIDRAGKVATVLAAIVDSLAPALAALICASPFFLVIYNVLPLNLAYNLSIVITLSFLFMLGLYLGKIAEGGKLRYGLYMLAAGLATSSLIVLLGIK